MYLPFVISDTIEQATPISAGSPVNSKWSSFVKSFRPCLNLKTKGPGEKIIWENSGYKNLNSPYSCAPIIFILGLPACVPAICCIT